MGWLEDIDAKQTAKIKALDMQPGWFVQLNSEFGDVWHEVEDVFDSACTIYDRTGAYALDVKTSYTFFSYIRTAKEYITEVPGSFMCKEGSFSEKRNNIKDIPKKHLPFLQSKSSKKSFL